MEWVAKWEHAQTGVIYTEYDYCLYDLKRELVKLVESGHKITAGPYPKG